MVLQHASGPATINADVDSGSQTSSTDIIPYRFTHFEKLAIELQLAVVEAALVSNQPVIDLKPVGVSLDILQTCKWIYDQGSKIFFSKNVFHFSDLSILLAWIKSGTFPELQTWK